MVERRKLAEAKFRARMVEKFGEWNTQILETDSNSWKYVRAIILGKDVKANTEKVERILSDYKNCFHGKDYWHGKSPQINSFFSA